MTPPTIPSPASGLEPDTSTVITLTTRNLTYESDLYDGGKDKPHKDGWLSQQSAPPTPTNSLLRATTHTKDLLYHYHHK